MSASIWDLRGLSDELNSFAAFSRLGASAFFVPHFSLSPANRTKPNISQNRFRTTDDTPCGHFISPRECDSKGVTVLFIRLSSFRNYYALHSSMFRCSSSRPPRLRTYCHDTPPIECSYRWFASRGHTNAFSRFFDRLQCRGGSK